MKKCNLLLIVIALLFSSINPVSINAEVNVAENVDGLETEITEEKVYSSYSLNDDFSDDKVVVVIFHEYSGLDKEFYKEDFPGVDIEEINYLTSLKNSNEEYPYLNVDEYNQILELILKNPGKENVLEAIDILEENPIVLSAEVVLPDIIINDFDNENELLSTSINLPNQLASVTANAITPNDTYYSQQYSLDLIQAEDAWGLTTGAATVKVGVIDSGVYNHSDLSANLLSGWDFVNNNEVTTDDPTGHGTSVAGLIAAVGNNNLGIAGVAWNVKIVPLQAVVPEGGISRAAAISAIDYAAENNIPIINLSFGSINNTNSYIAAIDNYEGLVCCCAGNNGLNTDINSYYPACDDSENVISVANSTSTDDLKATSNYGVTTVDLAAPGTDLKVLSTTGEYLTASGTSLSTPLVAGSAALLLSYNPNLTAHEMKFALMDNVDKISSLSGKVASGGRLNIYKALTSLLPGNRARVYKSRISINSSSDRISWANVVLNNELGKCTYYEYVNGTMAQYDEFARILVLGDGNIDYLYNNETYLLNRTGVLADFKYKSRFSSLDCTQSIDMTYEYFGDKNGNQLAVSTTMVNVLVGDINSDNLITIDDAQLVLKYASNLITFSDSQIVAGDVNDDGVINATDALNINKYAAKTIESF